MEGSFNKLDLTGKLIIKATFGQDIRRIPIHNDDLTYDELVLMMQRVFRGTLDPNEELVLRYKDEDEDLVTISDNSDLSFALQYCRLLRLTITCKGLQEGPGVEGEVVRELRDIRDRVNKLLDLVADSGTNNSNGQQQEPKGAEVVEETASVQSVAPLESREFDPLGQMNQDQAQAPEVDTASQHSMQSSEMHAESHQNGASSGYPATQEAQAAPQYSAPPSPYPTSVPPPGPPNAQYSAAQYSAAGAPTASPMHTGYSQAPNQQQPPQATPASFPPTQPSFNQAPQAPSYSQAPMTGPPSMGGPYSQPPNQPQGYAASSQPAPSSAPTSYTSTQAPSYPPSNHTQAPAFPPTATPARPQGPPTGSFPASYPTFKPAGGPAFPPNGYAAAPGGPPTYPTAGAPSNPYSGGLPRPGAPQAYSYPGQQGPPGGQSYPQQ